MVPEIKKLFTEALRSGKYKQTSGMLRSCDDEFCCLGVLLDVTKKVNWENADRTDRYGYTQSGNFQTGVVHWEIREELLLPWDSHETLIRMNDNEGKSFEEIADWIDANL